MRVAIAGAGNVGRSIAAELLDNGHSVLLIEREQRSMKVATVPGAEWLLGDACEVDSLVQARLQECDVVVAATGDDKVNLVLSLLAKTEFGVDRVVARVNHPKNQWLFNETWGVDVSVSTPQMLTALVEEAVSVGTLVRILQLAQGEARLVEVTLAEDSPAKGMSLTELEMPRDATIVAVVRDQRVVVPHGDTVLYASDEVIALVTEESEGTVKALLVGG
jgi:trk system potassium uptake protein TrkA